ncbi:hypothetical protein EDB92DRAFT_1819652 [Lactarius akahatsu]|uniref:Uncharacterized protein n=1 Tax=Lactarius akahatsu TaxID=416441 RepID=A0AAD4Q9N8_9AGAM|nr:hypothetical protein EDB92DRAFT_1819652 [Lactarius akahatsu]
MAYLRTLLNKNYHSFFTTKIQPYFGQMMRQPLLWGNVRHSPMRDGPHPPRKVYARKRSSSLSPGRFSGFERNYDDGDTGGPLSVIRPVFALGSKHAGAMPERGDGGPLTQVRDTDSGGALASYKAQWPRKVPDPIKVEGMMMRRQLCEKDRGGPWCRCCGDAQLSELTNFF